VTEDIIGIDFINTHHLWYDPVQREVFFNKAKDTATLSLMSETHLPCLSKVILKVRYNGEIQKGQAHIATIKSDQSCLISGGPALIKIEKTAVVMLKLKIALHVTSNLKEDQRLQRWRVNGKIKFKNSMESKLTILSTKLKKQPSRFKSQCI